MGASDAAGSGCVATVLLEVGGVSVDYRAEGVDRPGFTYADAEGLYQGLDRLITEWEAGYTPFSYDY